MKLPRSDGMLSNYDKFKGFHERIHRHNTSFTCFVISQSCNSYDFLLSLPMLDSFVG
jgi:hypothetical protein